MKFKFEILLGSYKKISNYKTFVRLSVYLIRLNAETKNN